MLHHSFVPALNETFANPELGTPNGTLIEIACQPRDNCNTDQLAFRAILARALAQTRALTDSQGSFFSYPAGTNSSNLMALLDTTPEERIPAWSTHERIDFILQQSAKGAAAQCSGGAEGTTCGSDWGSGEWDGTFGLGQDLSALNIILANLPMGHLATVNDTASGAGGERGTVGGANGTSADGDGAGGEGGDAIDDAAAEDAASASAAGHVGVSSLGLLVAVGLMVLSF